MENSTANFTLRFVVKNLAQMERAINQINDKIGKMAGTSENANGRVEQVTDKATKSIGNMQKALDRTIIKWFSLSKIIGIVGSVVRKAFQKIDEVIGLKTLAKASDVAIVKIERLGKALKESYGGSAAEAGAAYTSLADILYGARTGKGISDQVAIASARYGIPLNAGNMSEEQLMTNIAVAMKNANTMYGMAAVREIADAFGIDQTMMLHLAEKGAAWDRNLPASSLAQMQADADRAKQLQVKLDSMVDELITNVLPLVVKGMEVLVKIGEMLFGKIDQIKTDRKLLKEAQENIQSGKLNLIKKIGLPLSPDISSEELYHINRMDILNKKLSKLPSDPIGRAQEYLNYYNANLGEHGIAGAIAGLENATGGKATFVPSAGGGQLVLTINDNAGVLKDTQLILTSAQNATLVK